MALEGASWEGIRGSWDGLGAQETKMKMKIKKTGSGEKAPEANEIADVAEGPRDS